MGRRIAPSWFLSDRLEDNRFQVARHPAVPLAYRRWLFMIHVYDEAATVAVRKRWPERQEFVKRHAQPVDVPAAIRNTLKTHRGHVAERAQHIAGPR